MVILGHNVAVIEFVSLWHKVVILCQKVTIRWNFRFYKKLLFLQQITTMMICKVGFPQLDKMFWCLWHVLINSSQKDAFSPFLNMNFQLFCSNRFHAWLSPLSSTPSSHFCRVSPNFEFHSIHYVCITIYVIIAIYAWFWSYCASYCNWIWPS